MRCQPFFQVIMGAVGIGFGFVSRGRVAGDFQPEIVGVKEVD
jgi:hypothetical protein